MRAGPVLRAPLQAAAYRGRARPASTARPSGLAQPCYICAMRSLFRFWPLLPLLAVLVAGYLAGLRDDLSWTGLAARQAGLQAQVAAHPLAVAGAFVAIYAAAVAVSFPGAVVLTLAGGLLFGTVAGAALTVAGATSGSAVIYLAARSALAPMLAARAGPALERFREGLGRNAFSYVLAVRLVPVIPFWLVNIAVALFGVRLAPFLLATAIGIAPATTIYSALGAGIGDVLAAGGQPDLFVVFTPPVLLPLLGLAALALAPAAWRAWRGATP
jgi:uncharacterized membrane protein YdjX (TVP38/TMEM64 family)